MTDLQLAFNLGCLFAIGIVYLLSRRPNGGTRPGSSRAPGVERNHPGRCCRCLVCGNATEPAMINPASGLCWICTEELSWLSEQEEHEV